MNWTNALEKVPRNLSVCFNFQLLNCSLAHMKTKPSTLSHREKVQYHRLNRLVICKTKQVTILHLMYTQEACI